ncbi:YdcF family protein [Pedobacter sp. BS3]|uniref:YdcF family protein n=1 Tax=Pedobacter sp. BS3 TaxID=2567937 RepID=UPI0011ECF414|nr:YdcF family protein [Pedobacter sp. BS3]TZF84571.1 YdcF family protein [Pedobacter sp. BS3]
MKHNLRFLRLCLFLLFVNAGFTGRAAQMPGTRDEVLIEKNFYILHVLETGGYGKILNNDAILQRIRSEQLDRIRQAIKNCPDAACYTEKVKFSQPEIVQAGDELIKLYQTQKLFKTLVSTLRSGGYYNNYTSLADTAFLRKAWYNAAEGLNNLFDVYVSGKKPRYPKIDSISFSPGDKQYREQLTASLKQLSANSAGTFYTVPLLFSVKVLRLNDRDEAARYEPLNAGLNEQPCKKLKSTNWKKYPYSLILVPGLGPEEQGVSLDPGGAVRCDSAAAQYKKGLAPFIVVSGGHVHPNKTPFCEAVEMKKYLVDKLHVPADAVFIEPHARHTTTNMRNVGRMIYRFGIPADKPVLTVTDVSQNNYILKMAKRGVKELGYVPYRDLKQVSATENAFYPVVTVLQANPIDPLDP